MCRCTPGRNLLDSDSILIGTDSVTLLLGTIPMVYIKVGSWEGGGKVVGGESQKYSYENNKPTLYLLEHMAVTASTRRIIKKNKRNKSHMECEISQWWCDSSRRLEIIALNNICCLYFFFLPWVFILPACLLFFLLVWLFLVLCNDKDFITENYMFLSY